MNTFNIHRREVLRLGAIGTAGAMLSGCSRLAQRVAPVAEIENIGQLPAEKVLPAHRLLNRVAFGPRPGDAQRVAQAGIQNYIEEQLQPDESDEQILKLRLHSVEVFGQNAHDLHDIHERHVLQQLQTFALLRAVYSRHQLRERMCDFWTNHFHIYAHKNYGTYYKVGDETAVIRRHALGKFPELLKASAQSPAMLNYLDNSQNKRGRPNENYARELMELHTMGAYGGYTQKDVREVARCFTGWSIEDRFLHRKGSFRFVESLHDDGEKIVLGHKIPANGGQNDALRVLDLLAKHPSTAKFISAKICRYFLGEENRDWTKKLSKIYQATGGDLKAMLRPLLLSEDILNAPPIVKRPFDFVVSSLRALNADTDAGAALQKHLNEMGQPLYRWPMPDGYPDATQAWTGSLLARWNFALALCSHQIDATTVDVENILKAKQVDKNATFITQSKALCEVVFGSQKPAQTFLEYSKESDSQKSDLTSEHAAALLLCSPQFQWR